MPIFHSGEANKNWGWGWGQALSSVQYHLTPGTPRSNENPTPYLTVREKDIGQDLKRARIIHFSAQVPPRIARPTHRRIASRGPGKSDKPGNKVYRYTLFNSRGVATPEFNNMFSSRGVAPRELNSRAIFLHSY